jgi:hypothetical protein
MKMNILCVIDSLGSGGAQRQLVNLAISFKERGHNVSFLVYHSVPFYYKLLEENEISITEVLENNYVKRLLRMRAIIRRGKFDSVLSFLESPNFICEVSSFPFRKWGLVVGERSANPNILTSFKLRFFRFFHFFADSVVANSNKNIALVKKANYLLCKNNLHVIYNVIDFKKWSFIPEEYKFRKNGRFNLTIVASHQHLKNLSGLVEAVNLLDIKYRNQLVVNWFGGDHQDGSKVSALDKINQYNLSENFNFHEPTLDISSKVNQADALGLFSIYEGLPNAVCEAMANSKTVISSNVSDINIFLDKEFIFNPYNIYEISSLIERLLRMTEQDLFLIGKKNKECAIQLFNKEVISQSYLNLLS